MGGGLLFKEITLCWFNLILSKNLEDLEGPLTSQVSLHKYQAFDRFKTAAY